MIYVLVARSFLPTKLNAKNLFKGPVKLSNEYKPNILKGLFKNTFKMKSKHLKGEHKAMNNLMLSDYFKEHLSHQSTSKATVMIYEYIQLVMNSFQSLGD
jgi:hypothetical protein